MAEQHQLAAGDILDGKYRVEALIGSGGMGAVYRARHLGLDAARAIKLMRPELAKDASFVHRFENEAHLAEGVRHPNVVALYDFATLPDGTKYIVWELVEGETVRDCLERGDVFARADVIRLVEEIGGGLAAAHAQGILHRDVSPDNIMLCDDGSGERRTAKLLDFGVAKAAGTPQSLATTAGMVFGKIGYASPEQMGLLKGEASLDARADIFSLAAVAYAMLTGAPPFATSSMRDFLHDLMIAPEAEHREQFHEALDDSWREPLTRALARNRDERPATMDAFVKELRELDRLPAPAHATRSRNSIVVAAAAAFALVALAASVSLDMSFPPPPEGEPLEPRPVVFSAGADDPFAIEYEPIDPVKIDQGAEPATRSMDPPPTQTEKVTEAFIVDAPPSRDVLPIAVEGPEVPDEPPDEVPSEGADDTDAAVESVEDSTIAPIQAHDEATVLPVSDVPPTPPRKPERIVYVPPVYPERAKAAGVEGTVVLTLVIDAEGDVTGVTIIEGVNRDLDGAAKEAALQWKYESSERRPNVETTVGVVFRTQ